MTNTPTFFPGAKVCVISGGWQATRFRADEVLAVHKNGNFTLKSSPKQQWRQSGYKAGESRYSSGYVELWTPKIDKRIAEERARRNRERLVNHLAGLRFAALSDEALNAIAAIVAADSLTGIWK